ncbi:MAG: hypothetical protein JNJ69_06975 [Leptospiraceae bacterium]|nr:hypothetical protein [Leptospiraceae bacterium]
MSRKGTRKASADSHNLVTILFVLGVLGWGFFAIDRLTDSEGGRRRERVQGRAAGQEAGWKKSARDWLTKKLGSGKSEPSSDAEPTSVHNIPQGEIPLLPEPGGLRRDRNEDEETAEAAQDETRLTPEFFFYRLNDKGLPELTRVKRQSGGGNLKAMLSQVIKGPTSSETDKDFIDSFIRKPRILSVGQSGKCTLVDFDANFGAGVSYQTLRFQIEQIYRNVQHWQGSKCLELRVRGKYNPHLGSDGLFVPKRIDERWLRENS